MKKLLFTTVLLVIAVCVSFVFLRRLQNNQHPFHFEEKASAFLYQKKDIILHEEGDFVFDDFFSFIGNRKPDYRYRFEDDHVIISFNEQMFSFPYRIEEPEKEIIEKIVIKEIYKEQTDKPAKGDESFIHNDSVEKYFRIRKDHFSFAEGTDLSVIISCISDAVETSEKIVIDYSLLNPNEKGTYDVFLSSDEHSARITIAIT